MSETSRTGILYTEHSDLRAATPIASLWSYEAPQRSPSRQPVALNRDGNHEYWLERTDPLLNTILPGTGVSLIVNFGESWAAGRSRVTSTMVPRACVVGTVTQARILTLGRRVHAVGAVVSPTYAGTLFGAPAPELVDRIVPLDNLWPPADVDRLVAELSPLRIRHQLTELRHVLLSRLHPTCHEDPIGHTASRLIGVHGGRVSIDALANRYGVSRQQFARRFCASGGVRPKLFVRITRFNALVNALLSTDVSRWAALAPAVGFYDQAHMINEFRAFAGESPTAFFQPRIDSTDRPRVRLRGKPYEWPALEGREDDDVAG
jgi:AraC-like DNA-binding protein